MSSGPARTRLLPPTQEAIAILSEVTILMRRPCRSGRAARARDWLKAERAAWAKVLDSGGLRARPLVQQTLEYWRVDPDLVGVRDADARVKLPEAEHAA